MSRLKSLLDRVAERRPETFERSFIGGRDTDTWTLNENINISDFNNIARLCEVRIRRTKEKSVTPRQTDLALSAFEQEIEKSKFILDLRDDDDPDMK